MSDFVMGNMRCERCGLSVYDSGHVCPNEANLRAAISPSYSNLPPAHEEEMTCPRCGKQTRRDDVHTCSPRRDALAGFRRNACDEMLHRAAGRQEQAVHFRNLCDAAEARVRAVVDAARKAQTVLDDIYHFSSACNNDDCIEHEDCAARTELRNALRAFDGEGE